MAMPMKRKTLLIAAMMIAPTGALGTPEGSAPNVVFKDLPGVVPPSVNPQSEYRCTIVTRPTRRKFETDLLGDEGLPVLVYRCERDGMVFESTRPPSAGEWYPGVNPRTIDE